MKEETANTDVIEDKNVENNGSDSSSDEVRKEENLDEMDVDQLREFAKREREAKKQAIENMRNQEKKHRQPIEEVMISEEEKVDDEEEVPKGNSKEEIIALVREEARRVVAEEQKQSNISTYSKGSTEWLKGQSWATEMFNDSAESDKLYANFSKELKRLSQDHIVENQKDFQKLMRLAVVNVTGEPTALLKANAEEEIVSEKKSSAGYRPSGATQSAPSYSSFSERDRIVIDRINQRRAANGEKPLKLSEIIKK